jgi:hypothetical protein
VLNGKIEDGIQIRTMGVCVGGRVIGADLVAEFLNVLRPYLPSALAIEAILDPVT